MRVEIIPESDSEKKFAETSHVVASIVWSEKEKQYAYMFDLNYTDWLAKMPQDEIEKQLVNLSATLVNTFAINIAKDHKHNGEQIMAGVLKRTPEAFAMTPDPNRRPDLESDLESDLDK